MSSAVSSTSAAGRGTQSGAPRQILGQVLRYGGLMFIDAFALLLIYQFLNDGIYELAIVFAVITIMVNVINLNPRLIPLRWITPALALMTLMVIYPIVYTVYVSLTNFGDGHLLTKQQVARQVERERYLPEDAVGYTWEGYTNEAGEYAVIITDASGNSFFLRGNEPLVPVTLENGEAPETYEGYTRVSRLQRTAVVRALSGQLLGPDQNLGLTTRSVAPYVQRYVFDPVAQTVTDQLTGDVYVGKEDVGYFWNEAAYQAALAENPEVRPSAFYLTTTTFGTGAGYRVPVGIQNFERFFNSPAISGPLGTIFVWTFTFAFVSVASTFAMGLLIALLLQAKTPGRRIFRTLLIVPYAIPALIGVGVWRGMLNPTQGVIGQFLSDLLGYPVPVFSDPTLARVSILFINLWLGYPYFMLVCSGALASIPRDMYEAAEVDGANPWQQFINLTMPMLMVAVGPLLIASFTFNFNNFVVIDTFAEGGPPIPGTPTPAGHTDILISYAFRLAFGTGRGADYGLASAITMIIFVIVAAITLIQFRFTRSWEEVSENV